MSLVSKLPKKVYYELPKQLPLIDQYPLYALDFDGVDGRGVIPNVAALNPTLISIGCWFKPDTVVGTHYIISKRGGLTDDGYWIQCTTDDLLFYLRIGAAWVSAVFADVLEVGKLFHVMGTYDKSNIRIFVNGVEGTPNAQTADWVKGTDNLIIGAYWNSLDYTYFTDGVIGLPFIYDRTLSLAEIRHNIYNPLNPAKDGLVLFLPMLEGSGATVEDYSGNGNDGTLYGGVTWEELMKYQIPASARF